MLGFRNCGLPFLQTTAKKYDKAMRQQGLVEKRNKDVEPEAEAEAEAEAESVNG